MYRLKTIITVIAFALMVGISSTAWAGSCGSCSYDKKDKKKASYSAKADIPTTASNAGKFNTLLAAAKAAGLVDTLKSGPITVLAPTDAAFAKLPKGTVENLLKKENRGLLKAILTYHVIPGKVKAKDVVKLTSARTANGQQVDIKVAKGKVMIDKAKVIKTDIKASNGVIHVLDSVIMPSTDDIIATAGKAGAFNTLAAAVRAAGLVETLKGKGPFTVFAPTDEAFAKLPDGTLNSLLKPENRSQLQAVLTYHVVPGRVFSDQALKVGAAKTIQGGAITIEKKSSGVFINGARLVKADVDASNGVIHVIDSVLLPPTATADASVE